MTSHNWFVVVDGREEGPLTVQQLISMGVRAEQQALAMWGLNYVIDEYLPAKLANPDDFLP